MFVVRPICVQDSIFKMPSESSAVAPVNICTVGELRSTLCTKTPLYVQSGSYIKQMPLEHLSYIKQMPLEHLSYIKETLWNTSGRT